MHLSPEVFVMLVAVAGLAGFVDAIAGGDQGDKDFGT